MNVSKITAFTLIISFVFTFSVKADVKPEETKDIEILYEEEIEETTETVLEETTETILEETTLEETTEIATEELKETDTEETTEIYIETSSENTTETINKNQEESEEISEYEILDNVSTYKAVAALSEGKTDSEGNSVNIGIARAVDSNINIFTCKTEVPLNATNISIEVQGGTMTIPETYDGIEFKYGITDKRLYDVYESDVAYECVSFKINNSEKINEYLSNIIYNKSSSDMTIKITSTSVNLKNDDIFLGHIYRLEKLDDSIKINDGWLNAVKLAHETYDEDYGEYGYIANITSPYENTLLSKLLKNDDGTYKHTWIGGTSCYRNFFCTIPYTYETLFNNGNLISTNKFIKYSNKYHNALSGEDFYWIDGPEALQQLPNNTDDLYEYWNPKEPNDGHCVYVGWEGAYWDDLKLDQENSAVPMYYVIEFGGLGDGLSSKEAIGVKEISDIDISYIIKFFADPDTGYYYDSNIKGNGDKKGAISFNYQLLDCNGKELDSNMYNSIENFGINVFTNDNYSISVSSSNIDTLFKNNGWYHVLLPEIKETDFNNIYKAEPFVLFKNNDTSNDSSIEVSVSNNKWVEKDWQYNEVSGVLGE